MKYWFFKLDKNFLNDNIIYFERKSKFKGQVGDRVVLITNEFGELSFTSFGIIDSIKFEELFDKSYVNKISLTIEKIAEQTNYLKNYTYSIRRITNYKNPELNFKTQLGSLHEVEFEGIIHGEFFYVRTAFGNYVNALPRGHQLEFIKYFMELAPEIYFSDNKNFDRALEILEKYIEDRITIPAKFMNEGFKILTGYVSEVDIKKIGVSNSENTIDYLKPQIDIIENHLEEVRNKEEKFEIAQSYRSSDFQSLYKKRFAKTDWPIKLNYETGSIR